MKAHTLLLATLLALLAPMAVSAQDKGVYQRLDGATGLPNRQVGGS